MQYRNLGRPQDDRPSDCRLVNCGYYKEVDLPVHTVRELPRPDHHMILVCRGQLEFRMADTLHRAESGSLVYLPPLALQDYTYRPGPGSCYYWLHFDGAIPDRLLADFPAGLCRPGDLTELTALLDTVIAASGDAPALFSLTANGCLQLFLGRLLRQLSPQPALTGAAARLQPILRAMQESPEEARSNADYATALGISEYHFVRLFRSLTGQTPHRYRIGILMQKARQLLLDTDLNVSEIAQSLNIGDALYFSRLFKKVWGVSPSRCRAAYTQKNVRL